MKCPLSLHVLGFRNFHLLLGILHVSFWVKGKVLSHFTLSYAAAIHYTTSSATRYNCVDGRGLFQEQRNFKNAQECYIISKLDSCFEIGICNFTISDLCSAISKLR